MYRFDAVVTLFSSFFVQSQIVVYQMMEQVEAFLALLRLFVTDITQQIDGLRVC